MTEKRNRLSEFLSKGWWAGVAVIITIVLFVLEQKFNKSTPENDNHSQKTLIETIHPKKDLIPPPKKVIIPYFGKGTACKGDSIRAWDEAYQRAKNNLLENLQDKNANVANASIDFRQSTRPILTQNGWKATVVVYIKK